MTRLSGYYLQVLLMAGLGLVAAVVSASSDGVDSSQKANILQADHRTPEFVLRDKYRHPLETLAFFDVQPSMSVVEIWPGKGWYTELLAPYLRDGVFYAAGFPTNVGVAYYDENHALFLAKLEAQPDVYAQVKVATFDPNRSQLTVPDGSADRLLTFRNVHNWLKTENENTAFELFYQVLKPGGVLGVVEHRANEGTDLATMKSSGYVTEKYVVALAEKAGFIFEGKSAINSNSKDTKDYANGVWTLPPSLRLKEQNKATYLAIGESDRMTLKFRKPE